jgi:DNA-directed RNA polymerase subunit RPC12/RpoP
MSDHWSWLGSTRELQEQYFNVDYDEFKRNGLKLADYFRVQALSINCEVIEFLDEVNWKPWSDDAPGDVPDRDAAVSELIDAAHFLANLACVLGVTDEEWEAKYQAKQERNRERQRSGEYTRAKYKCPKCARELDRPGAVQPKDNEFICNGCGTQVEVLSA